MKVLPEYDLHARGMRVDDATIFGVVTGYGSSGGTSRINGESASMLAQELEKIRKEKGITQGELARRMGTKQSGIARMINNPDSSTLDNLMKGLIALGTPISRIAACLLL